MKIEPNFAELISRKTGLTSQEDIIAYTHFVLNTDHDNRVIMYGGVEHNFYQELYSEASEAMQILETAYHNSIGNHEGTTPWTTSKHTSPLSKKAKQEFAKYYHKFMDAGLISPPKIAGMTKEYYPHLEGYNYYNDADVYVAYKEHDEETFSGRMHIDTFNRQTEEQKSRHIFNRQL